MITVMDVFVFDSDTRNHYLYFLLQYICDICNIYDVNGGSSMDLLLGVLNNLSKLSKHCI